MPQNKLPTPERASVSKHKKEYLLQILLPILLTALIVVGLVVFLAYATLSGGGALGNMKDISFIWIMLPMLLSALILLVVLIAAIYGMGRLLDVTEPFTGKVQKKVYQINETIRDAAAKVVKPVITAKAWIQFFNRKKGN